MIDENRLKHIYAVAKLMEENAEKQGLDKQEMFMLGFLHDIGYEFGGSEEHHIVAARMLENENYKYFKEVLFHGMPNVGYKSPALDLLNFADMHINKKGEYVSFEDRLKDIAERRGKESPHYKNCTIIIEGLKKKGFADELGKNSAEPQK